MCNGRMCIVSGGEWQGPHKNAPCFLNHSCKKNWSLGEFKVVGRDTWCLSQLNLNVAQSSVELRRLDLNSSALSVIRSRTDVLNKHSALIYSCDVAGVLDLVTSRDQKAVLQYLGEIQKRSAIEMAENPKPAPKGSVKITWKFTEEPRLIEGASWHLSEQAVATTQGIVGIRAPPLLLDT